jgi:hypothetical protein
MTKQFYSAKDLQEMLEISKATSYTLINKLQEAFKKDNPNCITMNKFIPVKYFEEKCLGKVSETNEKN